MNILAVSGKLKKLQRNIRLNTYPDDSLWISIQNRTTRRPGAVAHTFAHGFDIRSFSETMRSFAPGKLRAHLSSRVGACGRRPLESADPGVRRVGAFGTESNEGLGLGKLYGGRGLGTTGGPQMSILLSRISVFMMGK